jgi:excisionase family DNA binding protein
VTTQEATQARRTMTVEEAAVQLGVSRSSAYEGVRRGDIPVIKIGRRLLVPTAHLQRMLGDGPTTSDAPAANRGAAERLVDEPDHTPARAA